MGVLHLSSALPVLLAELPELPLPLLLLDLVEEPRSLPPLLLLVVDEDTGDPMLLPLPLPFPLLLLIPLLLDAAVAVVSPPATWLFWASMRRDPLQSWGRSSREPDKRTSRRSFSLSSWICKQNEPHGIYVVMKLRGSTESSILPGS